MSATIKSSYVLKLHTFLSFVGAPPGEVEGCQGKRAIDVACGAWHTVVILQEEEEEDTDSEEEEEERRGSSAAVVKRRSFIGEQVRKREEGRARGSGVC